MIFFCFLTRTSSKKDFIAIAISEIIEQHFLKNSIAFDFIASLDSPGVNRTLKNVVKRNKCQQDYKVIKIKICANCNTEQNYTEDRESNSYKHHENDIEINSKLNNETPTIFYQNQSAILLFPTFDTYFEFDNIIGSERYKNFGPMRFSELIYCQSSSVHEIEQTYEADRIELFSRLLSVRIINQFHMKSFLIEDTSGEITLMILNLFTPSACGSFKLVEVNRFSTKKLKWNSNEFFTPEINNFNGCPLEFRVNVDARPACNCSCNHKDEKCLFEGYLTTTVEALASSLNYTYGFHCDEQKDYDLNSLTI